MSGSSTSAVEDLLKSTAAIGVAGLALGRMKARSRSLSRSTISAGISVPSSSRILTSLTCVSILYSSDTRRYSSAGSTDESASTVKPDGIDNRAGEVLLGFRSDWRSVRRKVV